MKIELPSYLRKFGPTLQRYRRYLPIMVFVVFMLLSAGLVLQINRLSRQEPSEDAVTEKLTSIKTPKVDQATLNKIQQLQDQNVDVKSLFDQARNNPFSE